MEINHHPIPPPTNPQYCVEYITPPHTTHPDQILYLLIEAPTPKEAIAKSTPLAQKVNPNLIFNNIEAI